MNLGIYIYDNAEVLDFSGPFEVFSTAKRLFNTPWNVQLIGETGQVIQARGGFRVCPDFSIHNHPRLDLLIVVGGVHNLEVKKKPVIQWIANIAPITPRVVSVCTGAFLLAEAGLLNGLQVTTHWEDLADLAKDYPTLRLIPNCRWVHDGKFTTSAGISAGIDMSLAIVAQLLGESQAEQTAKQMDYRWQK